ncbi:MAG: type II toxin-antitoxin system VapC family toxin [Defluviicoccus sp.]
MFIDASAIVAILGREAASEELEKRLANNEGPFFISPLVMFEAAVALARQKSANRKPSANLLRHAFEAVAAFAEDIEADEIAISPAIGRSAFDACAACGKAVGHVADLNFGDCFAYACAKTLKVPLIYKGNDFAHTDLA